MSSDQMIIREYELLDTGIFDDNRYFDVEIELGPRHAASPRQPWYAAVTARYAQADPDDTLAASSAIFRLGQNG